MSIHADCVRVAVIGYGYGGSRNVRVPDRLSHVTVTGADGAADELVRAVREPAGGAGIRRLREIVHSGTQGRILHIDARWPRPGVRMTPGERGRDAMRVRTASDTACPTGTPASVQFAVRHPVLLLERQVAA